ncbi:MAG: hypothetical protein NVSMB18_20540 [Acetobacteraceae bacterium]
MLSLAACQQPTPAPRSRADAAARADCRASVDRVYAAQNRGDLSRRDERDNPFAGSSVSGIVTRGLSSRYGRDNLESSCLNASGDRSQAVDTGTAPTFSPTSR